MNWLTPLGFLGFIGIAILILIYILKPNYQQKFISSTYVWELSLKYKKKRLPINKFRNILLFLCQILAITACTFILAQPFLEEAKPPVIVEKVAIIDAAANMRTAYDEETRFERAVFEVQGLAEEVFEQNGYMTVIVAGAEAEYLAQRVTAENSFEFFSSLTDLVQEDACSYGKADIDGAIDLAQRIVDLNSDTQVFLYTATEYLDPGAVTVVDVSENGEWNAAILDCKAVLEENYYTFRVSVASYNRDADLMVSVDVKGANGGGTIRMEMPVRCDSDQTKTISFVTGNMESKKVYEFESVRVYLSEADSFATDNDFFIYGGKKPELNMLYYNPHANIFVGGSMLAARSTMSKNWDVNYKEINSIKAQEIPVTGYDFYVYEGTLPDVLPTDGVVLLINPDKAPLGLTMALGNEINGKFELSPGEAHPITNRFDNAQIEVQKYIRVLNWEGFKPLMYCGADPVLLVKEDAEQKIVVMTFSMAYSMVSMYVEFPILMYNILQHFLPATLTGHSYDVNQQIQLDCRSDELKVESTNGGYKETFKEFPQTITLSQPGSYSVTQTPMSGTTIVEQFFVKIPASESNISQVYDELSELIVPKKKDTNNLDLILYFAAALVALIFAERLLQAQGG